MTGNKPRSEEVMKHRVSVLTTVLISVTAGLRGQLADQPGETSTNFQVLSQISGDGDGHLAGVTADGAIHIWNGKQWKRLDGQLHNISIGSPKDVWGINKTNHTV